ncbi:hypothetical protein MCETHM1_02793 [Flavobacteriaceae bacterium]
MKLIIKQFFFYLMLLGYLNLNAQNTDCTVLLLANDLTSSPAEFKTIVNESKGFDAWQLLNKEKPTLRTNIEELNIVSKNLEAIKNAGGYVKWKELQVANDLLGFTNKTLAQKLDDIKNIWNTKYPIQDMLGGRSFFEDIMGQYRYLKSSGWNHTGDISFNVKGIDFYKGTQQGGEIFANTAVSMKTTIQTNVDDWLRYQSVQDNIRFLKDGLKPDLGLIDLNNKLTMFITNAEIHIYMPKANITESLKTSWMNKLNIIDPKIKFEIKALEDFIK